MELPAGQPRPWYKTTGGMITVGIISVIFAVLLLFALLVGYYLWGIKYNHVTAPISIGGTGFTADPRRAQQASKTTVPDFVRYIKPTSPVLGSKAAPITILAFIDFECPFCQKSYPITQEIFARYAPVIRVVFKHLPVESLHPNALRAALASACAEEQNKFWQYYDLLFQKKQLDNASLLADAVQLELDQSKFSECLVTEKYTPQITADLIDAGTIGVRGTPTYIVNGRVIEGVATTAEWDALLIQLLQKKP